MVEGIPFGEIGTVHGIPKGQDPLFVQPLERAVDTERGGGRGRGKDLDEDGGNGLATPWKQARVEPWVCERVEELDHKGPGFPLDERAQVDRVRNERRRCRLECRLEDVQEGGRLEQEDQCARVGL